MPVRLYAAMPFINRAPIPSRAEAQTVACRGVPLQQWNPTRLPSWDDMHTFARGAFSPEDENWRMVHFCARIGGRGQ